MNRVGRRTRSIGAGARRVAVLAVFLFAVSACAPWQDEISAAAPSASAQFSLACPSGFTEVVLAPDRTTNESVDLSKLTACTDGAGRGHVKNNSDEVWLIDSPAGLYWNDAAPTVLAAIFRASLETLSQQQELYRPAGLPVEPGTSAFFTLPATGSLHLTLDPAVQALWHGQQALSKKVVSKGQDYGVRLMSGNSATRASFLTCGLTAYRAFSAGQEVGEDHSKLVSSALGLRGDVTACSQTVQAAEKEKDALDGVALVSRAESVAVTEGVSWKNSTLRGIRAALSRLAGISR